MEWLHDERIDCFSGLVTLPIRDYLALVADAHDRQGNIGGQRDVLKTTTAKRIRERMVADIREGAVLPPVVVGLVESSPSVLEFVGDSTLSQGDFIAKLHGKSISIIDGMQRTEALLEAKNIDKGVLAGSVRVDFWLAKSVRALVYRMLVLNTGQVPWTLARQLSVVYAPLLDEIRQNVPEIARIITPDKPGRRVAGGQFSSDALIEMFMAFSLRKTNVDARENLSEEFSRLDLVANVADDQAQGYFYRTLSTMAQLDIAFDRLDAIFQGRFSRGRDIFGSQPARIGFIVAVSQHVLGKVGLDRIENERDQRMNSLTQGADDLIHRLGKNSVEDFQKFLRLDVLSEVLDRKVGQVGRYERSVFYEAFKLLIEERFAVPDMEPCWRAN